MMTEGTTDVLSRGIKPPSLSVTSVLLGCSSSSSYISTKATGLIGCSRRKNKNCNITIDIMEFEMYDDKKH